MARGPGDLVEVEVKAPVDDPDALRERLVARGAQHQGTHREIDTYLAHPARAFAETDEALRIRRAGTRAELTYKGPKRDHATKTRREITLALAEPEDAAALLGALGFDEVATVTKERETWRLEGTTVTLDRVEGLGPYAELERAVDPDEEGAAREAVLELARALGLDQQERRSYLELLLARDEEDRV